MSSEHLRLLAHQGFWLRYYGQDHLNEITPHWNRCLC